MRLHDGGLWPLGVPQHVVEQFPPVVRGRRDVLGRDPDPVQGLHAKDVAVDVAVGEDAGVGDAEALEVVGDQGGRRVLEREVEVDGVEALAVEEVVALGCDRGLEVGARAS